MSLWHAAVPLVAAMLALEYGVARRAHRSVFQAPDTLADLGCAVVSQIVGLAVAAVTVGGYRVVEQHVAAQGGSLGIPWQAGSPVTITAGWAEVDMVGGALISWVTVFLLVDLGQYLIHRLSHRVNLLWACHMVHHSSDQLNLAVAVRNSAFHGLFIWVFFLPGAWLGIPWRMVAVCYGLNVLYQFWLHTRLVGRLGWFERVFNTPSHHRVHHGREPKYLDRNFGGVLILWDRLFGTFQEEEEEPAYGPPLPSWNPVWANIHGFAQIATAWRRADSPRSRLQAIFGPPEVLPELATPPMKPPTPLLTAYVSAQMLAAVGATLLVVLPNSQPTAVRGLVAALSVVTVGSAGALLDGRRWALPAEVIRLTVVTVFVAAIW